jgi:SAM-dependent methyltransferase
MELVSCDYCGSSGAAPIARQTDKLHRTTTDFFTIVRCSNCGLRYTNPRPTQNEIGKYYAETYAFHARSSVSRRFIRRVLKYLANSRVGAIAGPVPGIGRILIPHISPSFPDPVRKFYAGGGQGALLDIGCGAGLSAHYWGEQGALQAYRRITPVAGVENSESARKVLAEFAIESWSDIDDVPLDARFGIIRMNWSLEHVHSPTRYFEFFRKHILPHGLVIITVPNAEGMIYRLAPDCVELPIHLYHFSRGDIERYAARHRFEVRSFTTFSYPGMFVAACDAGLFPELFSGAPSFAEAKELQRVLERFDRLGFGNDMIVVLAPDG